MEKKQSLPKSFNVSPLTMVLNLRHVMPEGEMKKDTWKIRSDMFDITFLLLLP